MGSIDRRKGNSLQLPARNKTSTLRILVEATGRVNYGGHMHDRKGIHGPVSLANTVLKNWKHYKVPMGEKNIPVSFAKNSAAVVNQPGFYKGYFSTESNADTYLDLSKWKKGLVWVNGICIGRFWNIGPTQTMFVPGCWLKKGKNEVMVFDMHGVSNATLSGVQKPILDKLLEKQAVAHKKPGQQWLLSADKAYHTALNGKQQNLLQLLPAISVLKH